MIAILKALSSPTHLARGLPKLATHHTSLKPSKGLSEIYGWKVE